LFIIGLSVGRPQFCITPFFLCSTQSYSAFHIDGNNEAFQLIGKYSLSGEGTDDFMMMLTSLKRNAYKIYPDIQQHNKVLFCAAHRS
jgi:hypothetical protein